MYTLYGYYNIISYLIYIQIYSNVIYFKIYTLYLRMPIELCFTFKSVGIAYAQHILILQKRYVNAI